MCNDTTVRIALVELAIRCVRRTGYELGLKCEATQWNTLQTVAQLPKVIDQPEPSMRPSSALLRAFRPSCHDRHREGSYLGLVRRHGPAHTGNMGSVPRVVVNQRGAVSHGGGLVAVVPPAGHHGIRRGVFPHPAVRFPVVVNHQRAAVPALSEGPHRAWQTALWRLLDANALCAAGVVGASTGVERPPPFRASQRGS